MCVGLLMTILKPTDARVCISQICTYAYVSVPFVALVERDGKTATLCSFKRDMCLCSLKRDTCLCIHVEGIELSHVLLILNHPTPAYCNADI
ncbi:hypothetical protein DL95DRAFT_399095 [Leptodontidium sp. 2 PMI_412]|nr:hypothetical protein DL95DRAFT_399095 [Leptodontidium sp. 2 PMI_412]